MKGLTSVVRTTIALIETTLPIKLLFKFRIGVIFRFELGPGIMITSLKF